MRRRLRKKLRKAEFLQYGFEVKYRLAAGLDPQELDEFLDRFLLEAIEANDLACGGGGGPVDWDFFVCPPGRASATEVQRRAVEVWLRGQKAVTASAVGAFQDAWQGPDEASLEIHDGIDAA